MKSNFFEKFGKRCDDFFSDFNKDFDSVMGQIFGKEPQMEFVQTKQVKSEVQEKETEYILEVPRRECKKKDIHIKIDTDERIIFIKMKGEKNEKVKMLSWSSNIVKDIPSDVNLLKISATIENDKIVIKMPKQL